MIIGKLYFFRTMFAALISPRRMLLTIFFMSGFLGLVYETLWQKQMIMLLGASAPAIIAVLGAFFAGIALGGRVGDAALSRFNVPTLRLYALAELTVAMNALAMPLIQRTLHATYLPVAHAFGATSTIAYTFRFIATMLAVLPATVAMGATIPFMAEALRKYSKEAVAVIYGFNALGAMVGSLVGSLCMVPAFGIRASLLSAFALNIIIVCVAYYLSRTQTTPDVRTKDAATADFSWCIAYFAAGAVALGAETTWLHILSMVTVNGPVLFATTLAVFLGAYAAGSLVVHPILSRRFRADTESAWTQIMVAVFLLVTVPIIRFLPNIHSVMVATRSSTRFPLSLTLYEVCSILLVVFLPALAMGIVFPAMSRVTSATGRLYFWGNIGSLFGIFVFGLVLIPRLGLNGSLMMLVVLSSLIGLWLLPNNSKMRVATVLSCLSAVTLWMTLPPFAKTDAFVKLLPDGSYGEFRGGHLENKILRYKEGQSSTITVRESPGMNGLPVYRSVYVDEQRVAATDPDAVVDSKMLAYLPAFLHPNPKRALSVGYGSGGTSWSLTTLGLEARTVEIEREVLNSAQLFPYRTVWNKPNFKAIQNDARDHLQTTDERYDFISTDVTNLQYNQNSTLYTVEYFGMMRDRLTKDGIACAWIPMSAISPESFRTLLHTFQHVYPHATLWLMNEIPTYFGILIGTQGPLQMDMKRMSSAMAASREVRDDLATIGIEHPYQIADSLLLDEDGMRAFTSGAPLHTDDDPVLEHSATYHNYLYYNHFVSNLEAALRFRPSSPEKFVVGLNPGELAEFKRVWIASKHWYEAFAAMSLMNVTSEPSTLSALAQISMNSATAAMQAHPGWHTWQDGYARMKHNLAPMLAKP